MDVDEQVDAVAQWVADAERITVLTGAGISTDSGIPDFRGPNGVWTKNPAAEKMATIQHYLADPDVRRAAWRSRGREPGVPGPAQRRPPGDRRAGAAGQAARRRHPERRRPAPEGRHRPTSWSSRSTARSGGRAAGTARTAGRWPRRWTGCGAGEEDPPCEVCGGILKSDTISFGQALVPEVIDRAMQVSEECDLLLAVGSTLSRVPGRQLRAAGQGRPAPGSSSSTASPTDDGRPRRRRPQRPDRRHPPGARPTLTPTSGS